MFSVEFLESFLRLCDRLTYTGCRIFLNALDVFLDVYSQKRQRGASLRQHLVMEVFQVELLAQFLLRFLAKLHYSQTTNHISCSLTGAALITREFFDCKICFVPRVLVEEFHCFMSVIDEKTIMAIIKLFARA